MNKCECGSKEFENKRKNVLLMGQVGAPKVVTTLADCCKCGSVAVVADEEE